MSIEYVLGDSVVLLMFIFICVMNICMNCWLSLYVVVVMFYSVMLSEMMCGCV